jgi:hypothetical protein
MKLSKMALDHEVNRILRSSWTVTRLYLIIRIQNWKVALTYGHFTALMNVPSDPPILSSVFPVCWVTFYRGDFFYGNCKSIKSKILVPSDPPILSSVFPVCWVTFYRGDFFLRKLWHNSIKEQYCNQMLVEWLIKVDLFILIDDWFDLIWFDWLLI